MYNNETVHSPKITASDLNKPLLFKFTAKFSSTFNVYLSDLRSTVVIYLTCTTVPESQASNLNSKLGFNEFQQTLVAQATIDEAVTILYSGDFISIELTPCLVDYVYSNGEAPGSLFVRLENSRTLDEDSPHKKILEDSISQYQTLMTKIGRDSLHQIKAWWSEIRNDYSHLTERHIKFITEDECGKFISF